LVSKTKMHTLVRDFAWRDVRDALVGDHALLRSRDDRGRTWLHVCCGSPARDGTARRSSIKTADVLLDAGADIDDAAFTEGNWRATPLWYAVARGRNSALAKHLLDLGCDPDHTLWAAAFNDDLDAIRLLVRYGAPIDARAEGDTPFLFAAKTSHFESARVLLALGADVDATDDSGMTALHYMVKKSSDARWIRMVVDAGARGDIEDPKGRTATELLGRKRSTEYRDLARRLSAP
jgi:ankyrin repeat protein